MGTTALVMTNHRGFVQVRINDETRTLADFQNGVSMPHAIVDGLRFGDEITFEEIAPVYVDNQCGPRRVYVDPHSIKKA